METLDQKRRKFYGNKYRQEYILELNKLVDYEVTSADLLSIVETDQQIVPFDQVLYYKTEIFFSEKDKLKDIINANIMDINASYFILTDYSIGCGAIKIPSIRNFNFDFQFDDEHAGIISLIECNLQEDIVLNFYSEQNEEMLEITFYRRKT